MSAISFGDLKAAALYFDRVIPVAFRSLSGSSDGLFLEAPEPIPVSSAAKLIYGEDAPRHLVLSYMDDWAEFMKSFNTSAHSSTDPDAYTELKQLYLSDARNPDGTSVRETFAAFAAKLSIPSYAVLLPQESDSQSFSEAYSCLTLSRVPLIDTSVANWDQIMEVRCDPESAKRLRRLRLFIFENYEGKPTSYVHDDILRRLEDYDQARRKHGFDLVTSSLSILLDSKNLQATAIASLAAAVFAGPLGAISAGAAVEVGNLMLEVSRKLASIRHLEAGHELGYLIDTNKRLK